MTAAEAFRVAGGGYQVTSGASSLYQGECLVRAVATYNEALGGMLGARRPEVGLGRAGPSTAALNNL